MLPYHLTKYTICKFIQSAIKFLFRCFWQRHLDERTRGIRIALTSLLFRISLGQSLVRAVEEAAVNAAREAKRAELAAQEIMASAREAADKANRALKLAENSRRMTVTE